MKIFYFFKTKIRYFLAVFAMGTVFLIGRSFPAEIITSEKCRDGKCQAFLENPNLSDESPRYYVNDVIKAENSSYYRLTFREISNEKGAIYVKIANPFDDEEVIGRFELEKANKDNFKEAVFFSDKKYTDVIFEKADKKDGAEMEISNVRITKLDISNESEIEKLKLTVASDLGYGLLAQSQDKSEYSLDQLKEPNIIFGEVFMSEVNFITEIELDFDIVKQGDGGGEKFKLDLREAEFDGNSPEISSDVISEVKFSFNSIEQYRQKDGKFKFPIFSRVEKGAYYFIGINNDKVAVNKFNHLLVRGTKDTASYADGSVAVKKSGRSYPAFGDMYFKIYGLNFGEYGDKEILGGSTIEDIGKGKGLFKYQTLKNRLALLDLFQYSEDVDFDEGKQIVSGENGKGEEESYFIYKFETIHPFNQITFEAKQPEADWSKVNLLYSYDGKKWEKAPFYLSNEKTPDLEGLQVFNFSLENKGSADTIYLKIMPEENSQEKYYGLRDLRVTANLIIR